MTNADTWRYLPFRQTLAAALKQFGPWSDHSELDVDITWLEMALNEKIATVNWEYAREDVRRFLRSTEAESLSLWSERFFASKLVKLIENY